MPTDWKYSPVNLIYPYFRLRYFPLVFWNKFLYNYTWFHMPQSLYSKATFPSYTAPLQITGNNCLKASTMSSRLWLKWDLRHSDRWVQKWNSISHMLIQLRRRNKKGIGDVARFVFAQRSSVVWTIGSLSQFAIVAFPCPESKLQFVAVVLLAWPKRLNVRHQRPGCSHYASWMGLCWHLGWKSV